MLEIIVTNVDDAINAEKGGAGRLEIVSKPEEEGLTPSLEVVKKIRDAVKIPVHVMIRERNLFENFSKDEVKIMFENVEQLNQTGVNGIVVGFIKNGNLDLELLKHVINKKKELSVTLHRVFDVLNDQVKAINEIINLKMIDRILTSGGAATAVEGAYKLKNLKSFSKDFITLIAAGSISEKNINYIKNISGINEFHAGRSVRINSNYNELIDPRKVEAIVNALDNS